MQPRDIKTYDDVKQIIEERHASHIKVGVFDIDGIMRGKYMAKDKFLKALNSDFGFCNVVLGWDMKDQLYDNVSYTGWHTGYPDAPVRLIPESCRNLPLENDGLFFLGEFAEDAEALCPRGLLKRVLERADRMGFEVYSGFEYEFFVFNETPHSIREKRYSNLQTLAPGEFGYSNIRCSTDSEVYLSLLQLAENMDFSLESLHEETGPGVFEAAIGYDRALESADKAALFKTFTKVLMQKQGKLATFMARWSLDYPGQSGHIHYSLRDKTGKPVFHDDSKQHHISDTMRHFLAGQQQLMPEFLAMVAPTINSYKRLCPGFWAPTEASIGIDNRTCAIRIIPGSASSQRAEYRVAAADANPYVILAAVIASGLWGIENAAEPQPLVQGSAYDQTFPPEMALHTTLWDAAQRLKASTAARNYFGDAFVDHFAATREWEEREYRRHVSQWELERYFEII